MTFIKVMDGKTGKTDDQGLGNNKNAANIINSAQLTGTVQYTYCISAEG